MLTDRLFNQGFSARKLMKTFYKLMGRYPGFASKFNISPSSIICVSVPMAQLYTEEEFICKLFEIEALGHSMAKSINLALHVHWKLMIKTSVF